MSEQLNQMKQATKALEDAKKWIDMPKTGPGYMGTYFSVSQAHCKPIKLTRCGQYSAGGTNYWESPGELNIAITKVILADFDAIMTKALAVLEEEKRQRIIECQEFSDELQAMINEAKGK